MKKLSYIIAVLCSLLIVYAGAGVSIVRYCCARCETVKNDCAVGCLKCGRTYAVSCDAKGSCEKTDACGKQGCTATIYKLELVQQTATVPVVSVPVTDLWCGMVAYVSSLFDVEDTSVRTATFSFSPPVCSRRMLALYSTLLI